MYLNLLILVAFLMGASSPISANVVVPFHNFPDAFDRLMVRDDDTFGGNATLIMQCRLSKDCHYASTILNRCVGCTDPAQMTPDESIALQRCTCKDPGSSTGKPWLDAYNACFKCFMDAGEDPLVGISATSHLSSFCAAATPVVSKFISREPVPSGVTITNTICAPPTITASATLDVSEAPATIPSMASTITSANGGPTALETVVPQFPPHPPSATTTVAPKPSSSGMRLKVPSFRDHTIIFDVLAFLVVALI